MGVSRSLPTFDFMKVLVPSIALLARVTIFEPLTTSNRLSALVATLASLPNFEPPMLMRSVASHAAASKRLAFSPVIGSVPVITR